MSCLPVPRFLRLAVVSLLWLCGLMMSASAQWEVKQIDGRDYVCVDGLKKFYGFDTQKQTGGNIVFENKKVEMQLQTGGVDCQMNGVKFVFSYKVEENAGKAWISRIDLAKLVDPVLRPNYIGNAGDFRTVVLDPGHGGKDQGAVNAFNTESAYNLDVAKRVKELLTKMGYKVLMTREDNTYLTLQERVDFANKVTDNAIFISIHHNSGGSEARGIETFTLSPLGVAHYGRDLKSSDFQENTGNSHDSANVALATAVHGSVTRHLGKNTFDRGIKRARFSVLTGVRLPSILIECGFMTHPYEARLIENDAYHNAIAIGIAEAVNKYRNAVSQKPADKP
ncbi:MAG: N-acetylmuramoyl-L-alanine amidase [Akkermansiaceae bacterium]|nr:N-acetylmuramoyl-L-alanine amidase [Akkermansiaceae bacterium]